MKTNASRTTQTSPSRGFEFTVTGLKHGEQYQVVTPRQQVGPWTYGSSSSRVLTVAKS